MDTRLIYKTSETLKLKIYWIKPAETEWIYCGAEGEVKWDVVEKELDNFFDDGIFHIATTRTNSFDIDMDSLVSSIQKLIGRKNFLIWSEDFQKAMEFNQIGVYRKGIFNADTNHPSNKINYNKIAPGSPDKVKGKSVKYQKGDCLSIDCANGKYLAVFISAKFNKYYDFTLIEYLKERKPIIDDFINGRFFGKYGEAMDRIFPAVEKHMLPCLDIDASPNVEKVGLLELIEPLELGSYLYLKDIAELLQHYQEDLPLRRQRTVNFEKHHGKLFTGDRLIEMKEILQVNEPLTQAL